MAASTLDLDRVKMAAPVGILGLDRVHLAARMSTLALDKVHFAIRASTPDEVLRDVGMLSYSVLQSRIRLIRTFGRVCLIWVLLNAEYP